MKNNKIIIGFVLAALIISFSIYVSRPSQTTPNQPLPQGVNNSLLVPTTDREPTSSKDCIIKGNISSSGERIYHVPNGQYYDRTIIDQSKGEQWFCTEVEAREAGWRKSLR